MKRWFLGVCPKPRVPLEDPTASDEARNALGSRWLLQCGCARYRYNIDIMTYR